MFGVGHEVEDGRKGGVVQGRLDVEDFQLSVEDVPHPIYRAMQGGVFRVHQRAGVL